MEERRPYTRKEDDYIMDNWTLKTHKEIAETLNRSVKSVISRHKKLVAKSFKKDGDIAKEASDVVVTIYAYSVDRHGLPSCQMISTNSYNILDRLKQTYDMYKYNSTMFKVISEFAHVIGDKNMMVFRDEIADALIYSGDTNEHIIKYCLKDVFDECILNGLCRAVAEKTKNETLNNDSTGYHDMLKLLKSDPVAALTSGKLDESFIGMEVTLPNSAITCQEWIIADVNHDGTSGTVDLFSKTALTNDTIQFSSTSQYYKGSDLDNYLESTVYNGFSMKVKNALNCMNVSSNGETIQRHVVAPSLREVGNSLTNYVIQEGVIYPIFSPASSHNSKSIFIRPDGSYAYYWTRSRYTHYSNYVCYVSDDGNAYNYNYDSNNYVVARLRFTAK